MMENLVFDDLIAHRKYQFVFIFPPTPIKGAIGSNGCPICSYLTTQAQPGG